MDLSFIQKQRLVLSSLIYGLEDLLDDLRVQRRTAMERNHNSPAAFCVDPMTTFGA